MESESSTVSPSLKSENSNESVIKKRGFLNHLEAHLSKREGVDKLLKIFNYATKIVLASSVVPGTANLTCQLKRFESSLEVSRKALRLGKFVQGINALRNSHFVSKQEVFFSIIANVGEGVYYYVEQFIWLVYSGLIDHKHLRNLEKISVWAEFIGYFDSISLTIRDLKRINKDEEGLKSRIMVAISLGNGYCEEEESMRKMREQKLMKLLSIVQDLAEGLMALADIRDGKGRFSGPLLLAFAGLLSAVISSYKTWISC